MADARKIRLLNRLLARAAPCAALCADAARGVEMALARPDSTGADIGIFAKRILALYDPEAAVETVEVSPSEPLFALAPLSAAAKRLAGHPGVPRSLRARRPRKKDEKEGRRPRGGRRNH